MAVYYFMEHGVSVFEFAPEHRFMFFGPSECCMLVPVSYAEMKDL